MPLPLLSVVVKCLNEEAHLARCLRSLVAATAGIEAEIIVADSLSSDQSVAIARAFPVRVVQFADARDRGCGAAAHLGWQFARGRFLLLVDGDMELLPGFLPAALRAMDADPRLAAAGGRLIEMSSGVEFRERQLRGDPDARPGLVRRVTGCGLYRMDALRAIGRFMNRNLHGFEEFELGLRLRHDGWRLRILDLPCVRHHGHRDGSARLLARRWRTRQLHGLGEVLRATWGKPGLRETLAGPCRLPLLVLGWWAALAGLAGAGALLPDAAAALGASLGLAALPFLGLLARKRDLTRAGYAWLLWQVSAAALVAGLLRRPAAPETPLAAVTLQAPPPRRQPMRLMAPAAEQALP